MNMANESFMARFGATLVDNGYAVIPILPGTKKPGRFHRGVWRDYPGWTRHGDRPTTLNEVEIWAKWPDCAIGIASGSVVAIDIDILDGDLAIRLECLARDMLGDTPLLRIGKAPKRLLVYRSEIAFSGVRRAPIEILGVGRQFVAFAVHPDTGRPYEWPEDSPLDVPLDALPAITEDQARAWIEKAHALLPPECKPNRLSADRNQKSEIGNPTSEFRLQTSDFRLAGTREAVASALAHIPNADLDYDSWVRIGMALKGALGEDGADLFAAWSAQAKKNVPETTAKTWGSFRPTHIGAGTLYHHAMDHGWRPDPALVLDGSTPRDPVHPAAGLLAKVWTPDRSPAQAPVAEPAREIVRFDPPMPGGILGNMVGYMNATARRPQPELALGASLCALGALMGRKYRTESNLRSNLYIIAIAESGSGKNHAREIVNELFIAAGLTNHLGGNKIASGAGLLTALHRQPAILFQLDEFGMFLSAAADRRRSPRHLTEILDNMTELYTAAGGIFLGAEYANRDGKNERRDIVEPCLCIYGTTAPVNFWNALQSANVIDGSLARFIIITSGEDYPDERETAGIRKPPASLVDALKFVASGGGCVPSGNLAGMTSDAATATEPVTVPLDEAARGLFRALSRDVTTRLREARGTGLSPILARIGENAAKIALILAVSNDPVRPVIGAREADWAIGFVRHYAELAMAEIERRVADNEIERSHKRVMEVIRSADGGITKNDLIRRTQFLDKRQRDDILAALVEAGMVAAMAKTTATKPALVYRAIEGGRP
ncbi:MAG: bifunctional DNA primase/polymerase [Rhodothalassiaceae bacterium]